MTPFLGMRQDFDKGAGRGWEREGKGGREGKGRREERERETM